jgi:hypothetical protein
MQPSAAVATPRSVQAQIKQMLPEVTADDTEAPGKQPRRLIGQQTDEPVPETEVAAKQKEDARSIVTSGQAQRTQKPAPNKATQEATVPSIAVNIPMPVPVPVKLKLPSFAEQPEETMQTESGVSHPSPAKREQAPDLVSAAALELRIRAQDQPVQTPVEEALPRAASASKPAQSGDEPADAAAEITLAEQYRQQDTRAEQVVVHAAASLPGGTMTESAPGQPLQTTAVIAAATPQAPSINESSGARTQQPISLTAHLEEPLFDEPKQQSQSLRSISIEFTPDGAQDVRLRLEERAGDVHISLHSTDPVLTGRLSEGVHDLVGTLANAGYDAQAWTPEQGRQNQRQSEDPRKNRRTNPAEAGVDEFGAVMQQPTESNP